MRRSAIGRNGDFPSPRLNPPPFSSYSKFSIRKTSAVCASTATARMLEEPGAGFRSCHAGRQGIRWLHLEKTAPGYSDFLGGTAQAVRLSRAELRLLGRLMRCTRRSATPWGPRMCVYRPIWLGPSLHCAVSLDHTSSSGKAVKQSNSKTWQGGTRCCSPHTSGGCGGETLNDSRRSCCPSCRPERRGSSP